MLAGWPSLGQLTGRSWAILSDFDVIMFFRKDRAQREGRKDAHPLIKTSPVETFRKRPWWCMIVLKSRTALNAGFEEQPGVSHNGNRTHTTMTLGGNAHSHMCEADCTLACRSELGDNLAGRG